ncbi:sulfite exporter TauE/SafE family protein [Flavilitoribacter nigricans]|uniref:Permease n=1 Tax=Flavilitoribacter nigricans (strain ATCC 23147 / DSM 23189 / NBRC 102662 / NCIMB 1420 / SS-2) TaxID=1122177 RepID=A0A2D0N1R4_FLAN2|nr:sulfite exporter TauE/SafE family protein [Flavilitoribacter nigricans]PHN02370.1 permease [Flavilitoribacter nigricans DSM 23189 = NBRC 102662]
MIIAIWIILIGLSLFFIYVLSRDLITHQKVLEQISVAKTAAIGFVVNFFDVLGIGAFAPQTALLKFTKQTEDRVLPGTLNVANTIPVLIQALIFIRIVEVEPITLSAMLLSATVGAVVGAGIVSGLAVRKIQLTMGFALLVTAFFMLAGQLDWIQGGGTAIGLTGWKLAVAVAVNFVLGALMTVGIGLYAPCMALVYALGMSPLVAFPIMMGSCAFLMPPASAKFIREGAYNRKAAISMAIPGAVAVLIAALVVKSLPLHTLRWVVIGVIIYTSVVMFRSGLQARTDVNQMEGEAI